MAASDDTKQKQRQRRRSLALASAGLLLAAVFAVAARELFLLQELPAAYIAGILAMLCCACVLVVSAPHVLQWRRLQWVRRAGVTREGLVFLTAVVAMGVAAIVSRNNLLYLILSTMLASILVSGLVSRLVVSDLQMRLGLPDHIFAEAPFLAKIRIRNLKRWMPSFSIWIDGGPPHSRSRALRLAEAYCPQIAPRSEVSVTLEARVARRGRYADECLWLRTKFPFSFIERRIRLRFPQEIIAYPPVDPDAEAQAILRRLGERRERLAAGDSHDIYRIRPSQPGESARFIHWKASARHRSVWVREFTREDRWSVIVEFDRHVPEDSLEAFERAVNRCAAVVWKLHTSGAEVRFRSGDVQIPCAPTSTRIYEILRFLALAGPVIAPGPEAPRPGKRAPAAEAVDFVRIGVSRASAVLSN